jgi:hypothetical protein
MGNKNFLRFLVLVFMCFFPGIALAQHKHDHGGSSPAASPKGTSQEMQMGNQPVQAITVEGFKVTFEVMDMSMHMSMPGMKGNPPHGASEHSQSHALMVKVEDTASKEIISDAKVQYTLIRPSGGKETGKLVWSGDQYGEGFSPKETGIYQFQLMIESGGMEREAKFAYEFK